MTWQAKRYGGLTTCGKYGIQNARGGHQLNLIEAADENSETSPADQNEPVLDDEAMVKTEGENSDVSPANPQEPVLDAEAVVKTADENSDISPADPQEPVLDGKSIMKTADENFTMDEQERVWDLTPEDLTNSEVPDEKLDEVWEEPVGDQGATDPASDALALALGQMEANVSSAEEMQQNFHQCMHHARNSRGHSAIFKLSAQTDWFQEGSAVGGRRRWEGQFVKKDLATFTINMNWGSASASFWVLR